MAYNSSRKINTIRNFSFGLGSYILNTVLSFLTRTIFIHCLASEYLGVNGLFSNILAVLSLAELGAGGAFVSMLYKPLADNDEIRVSSIMKVYRKVYNFVAAFIAVVGFFITPFLKYLIKDNSIPNVHIIYILYIVNTAVTYLCADRRDLIICDQKSYLITKYSQITVVVQYIFQIIVLLLTHSYILYLIIQVMCTIGNQIFVVYKSNKMYPYLSKAQSLSNQDKVSIIQKIKGGICVHWSGIITVGTSSIIISYFLGLKILGIYSNYLLIVGIIQRLSSMVFSSLKASVSNFAVLADSEKNYQFFKKINFFSFLIIGYFTILLIVLFNPFIRIWIGTEYLLKFPSVVLLVIVFVMGIYGIKSPIYIYRDAFGLYYNDRYISLIEGILNLTLSIFFVQKFGLAGVFIASIIASFLTLISGSYLVYKYVFFKSVFLYWKDFLIYTLITTVLTVVCHLIMKSINAVSIWSWIFGAICCTAVVLLGFLVFFCNNREFKYVVQTLKNMVLKGEDKK